MSAAQCKGGHGEHSWSAPFLGTDQLLHGDKRLDAALFLHLQNEWQLFQLRRLLGAWIPFGNALKRVWSGVSFLKRRHHIP